MDIFQNIVIKKEIIETSRKQCPCTSGFFTLKDVFQEMELLEQSVNVFLIFVEVAIWLSKILF